MRNFRAPLNLNVCKLWQENTCAGVSPLIKLQAGALNIFKHKFAARKSFQGEVSNLVSVRMKIINGVNILKTEQTNFWRDTLCFQLHWSKLKNEKFSFLSWKRQLWHIPIVLMVLCSSLNSSFKMYDIASFSS